MWVEYVFKVDLFYQKSKYSELENFASVREEILGLVTFVGASDGASDRLKLLQII